MKNGIITGLVIAAVFIGIRLAVKGGQYQYAEHQVEKGETFQAPEEFMADVLKGCIDEATEANRAYCQCAVDYLDVNYTDAEIQATALQYIKTNTTTPEMDMAVDSCIDKYTPVDNI